VDSGLSIVTGVVLRVVIGYSRTADVILYPLLVGFPKVTLVPLFALWFGIGMAPAVLMAFRCLTYGCQNLRLPEMI
jgi:ABC-type nitrate/sulfonate/bicarbonate transport system permease component